MKVMVKQNILLTVSCLTLVASLAFVVMGVARPEQGHASLSDDYEPSFAGIAQISIPEPTVIATSTNGVMQDVRMSDDCSDASVSRDDIRITCEKIDGTASLEVNRSESGSSVSRSTTVINFSSTSTSEND